MLRYNAIIGLIVILIFAFGNAYAGDLPEKDVVIQKDAEPVTQSVNKTESVSKTDIEDMSQYELEIMREEILYLWSEMTLKEKFMSIVSLSAWVVAWTLACTVILAGGPFFLFLAILAFFAANLAGANAMGEILL